LESGEEGKKSSAQVEFIILVGLFPILLIFLKIECVFRDLVEPYNRL
jgi:hypothetical protein